MELYLPQNIYQGEESAKIYLPNDWQVKYLSMPGDTMPELSYNEIRNKIENPVGYQSLKQLAEGKKRVCIVFDDITRGTPTKVMARVVLDILKESGVPKDCIEFLCALGTHRAHSRQEHAEKLGEEIVHDFPVYNHNCYENNTCIGKTTRGIDVCINSEFLKSDLRIGLGAITPHTMNGFGGGGKILFPGIASIDTIAGNHNTATKYIQENKLNSSQMTGNLAMKGMREEIEEMTKMVGDFFKIDCLYNSYRRIINVYAGDPIEEYYCAIPEAEKVYGIERITGADIVIVNANAKASEATIAAGFGALSVKPGGDIVIVDLTKSGQITHYLFGSFGRDTGGRMMGAMPVVRPEVGKYIFWMPYPDLGAAHWFGELEKQIYTDTWEEALECLRKRHPQGANVVIVSDGTLAYYRN